jgi:hypothetical protein
VYLGVKVDGMFGPETVSIEVFSKWDHGNARPMVMGVERGLKHVQRLDISLHQERIGVHGNANRSDRPCPLRVRHRDDGHMEQKVQDGPKHTISITKENCLKELRIKRRSENEYLSHHQPLVFA